MDDENQLERELEKELDAMPVQDLDDDDDDDDAYDEYDLIVIPGQPKAEQVPNSSEEEDEDEDEEEPKVPKTEQEKQEARRKEREAMLQRMRDSPSAIGGGDDLTTIEIMSSDDDDSQSDQGGRTGQASSLNESSDDDEEDEVGVIEDSDSEDDSSSEDSESDAGQVTQLERSFEDLMAQPHKQFAQLVKLSEIAFKLNDLARIELALTALQNDATVPAHIWLKYLKARLVVTQTPEECKEFADKCATALGYHYNIPLSEFIVGYLGDLEGKIENHVLWAKLLADYDVERPDYGNRLRPLLATLTDEKESAAFQELLQKHCVTWNCSPEQRETIKTVVDEFKRHLEDMKIQYNDWDWAKLHKSHVEEVLALSLDEDLQNALIRFIFERSVSKFPTADALWLGYMKFIQGEGEAEEDDDENAEAAAKRASRLGRGFLRSTVLDLAKRGVRCRPSIRLNHKLLVLMERADFEQPAVDEQIRTILQRIVPEMTMTVELHLDYLAYRVRNTNASDEEQATSLRGAFFRIWDELSSLYGDQADTRYEVLQLWAQVEYTHLGSPTNGATIWRQIMGYPGSTQRGLLWLGYAQMESEYNAGQGTRDVLREALSQPSLEDGLMVQELYRRYERCYGTYESIAACQALELPPEYVNKSASRRKPTSQPPQLQQAPRHNRPQQAPPNQQQQQPLNREQRRRQAHEMMGSKKPQPKATAPSTSASASASAEKPVTKTNSRPIETAVEVRESHLKYSPHLETNKVFVKNLHPACTKEELQELFSPYGNVKDVRLVHKQKHMKGIAYVEFEKPEEAQKAVAERNGYELHGLAIFVAISNPPPKAGSASDGHGAKGAPKRRVLTSLIPTTLVRQEAAAAKKRRIEVAMDHDGDEPSSSSKANGKAAAAAAAASTETEESTPAAAPKSNDDFRKLFIKDK